MRQFPLKTALTAVLFQFLTAVPESTREESIEGRIIRGSNAEYGQFPWVAALHYGDGNYICTASILGPNTVLTAAHCVYLSGQLQDADQFYAIANVNRSAIKVRIDFEKVWLHPDYDDAGVNDDLAIFTPTQPIEFSPYVRPVCIAQPNTHKKYKKVTAMGWGNTRRLPREVIPDNLQYVEQKVVANQLCKAVNPDVDENKMCAVGFFNGICNGDSGGPLVHLSAYNRPVQIGVASYINDVVGCGNLVPAVWTRISAYSNLIIEKSKDGGGICIL